VETPPEVSLHAHRPQSALTRPRALGQSHQSLPATGLAKALGTLGHRSNRIGGSLTWRRPGRRALPRISCRGRAVPVPRAALLGLRAELQQHGA